MRHLRPVALVAFVLSLGTTTACSDETGTAPDLAGPSFAKSGTAPSGGGSTGGGSTGGGSKSTTGGSTGGSTGGTVSGPPVVPSYTAHIDAIGVVPTSQYYGTPSEWTIGGYKFEGNFFTHLKAVNGPLKVGACVSVTFYEGANGYVASEIKSVAESKCAD